MDKLLVDIGNTTIKVAVCRDKELLHIQTFSKLEEEHLTAIFETYPQISHSIVSSVAEKPKFLESYLASKTCLFDWNYTHLGSLKIIYDTLSTLGQDRLAMAKAVMAQFPNRDVLCIAMGSCITYNFVGKDNVFYGGAISPGLQMRYKSIHHYTNALPLLSVEIEKIELLFAQNTSDAIQVGILKSILYELEGNIEAYTEKYPQIVVIITGGDVNYFEMSLKNRIFALPNLVLIGLNEILDLNVSKT